MNTKSRIALQSMSQTVTPLRRILLAQFASIGILMLCSQVAMAESYVIVDANQDVCYDLDGNSITCGSDYTGQDAEYTTTSPDFTAGTDTVTDNNTGLVWQKTPDYSRYDFYEADDYCSSVTAGGYSDWRLPTIKELYSIADFRGSLDPSSTSTSVPYIDTDYFDFEYDNQAYAGQYWSSNVYKIGGVQDVGIEVAFGFNFADGHIKGYETGLYFDGSTYTGQVPGMFVRCVRGEEDVYGVNDFTDNEDSTVTDNATNLMWQQADDGTTRDWEEALEYCEDLSLAGYTDWKLPDNKELQSIVDYEATSVPAIDTTYFSSTFNSSYGDSGDYGWYWSSTTFGDNTANACYIAFGSAYSTNDDENYYDWHGAGAQRSDPKYGTPSTDDSSCSVNACDEERVNNYVRCVRVLDTDSTQSTTSEQKSIPGVYLLLM